MEVWNNGGGGGDVGQQHKIGNPPPPMETEDATVELLLEEEGSLEQLKQQQPQGHPLDIFPEEVWKIILGKLETPMDLLRSKRVCTLFETLLKPTQCTWLFQEVFPHLFHYLSKNEILACRQTGREWSKVVGNYLENHRYYLPFDEATNDSRYTTMYLPLTEKGFGWTEFSTSENVIHFMERCKKSPEKNPFIGRSLWVQYQEDMEPDEQVEGDAMAMVVNRGPKFWPTVFQFLSKYGQHVWYFSMGTFGTRNTPSRFIYLLRNCLSHLPNLKNLHIFGWISDEEEHAPAEEDFVDNIEDFKVGEEGANFYIQDEDALSDYLRRRPLPVPPHLQTLEVEYMEELPAVIYDHLVTLHGSHLKCLRINRSSYLSLGSGLPSLKELHFKLRCIDPLDKYFLRLKSPLGKLNLDFSLVETRLDVERLFRLISNHFDDTLRVLQITVVPFTFEKISNDWLENWKPQPRLRLPHLQTLQLEGFKRISLNFLLDVSSSLKFLHLRHLSPDHRVQPLAEEVIDVYQYMHCNRLYESNIWNKMLKLETLSTEFFDQKEQSFTRNFYSREMYDYLDRNNNLAGNQI